MNNLNFKKPSLNDILLAPISALYAYTLKIHEGFKLEEEVRNLVTLQIVYFLLILISKSPIYMYLSIGNVIGLAITIILGSNYIDIPEGMIPNGVKRNKRDFNGQQQYQNNQQQYQNNQEQYQNNQQQYYNDQQYNNNNFNQPPNYQNDNNINNHNESFNQPNNINQNFNKNKEILFSENTLNGIDMSFKDIQREVNKTNFGVNNYNPMSENVHPFDTAGINTNNVTYNDNMFDMDNSSNIPIEDYQIPDNNLFGDKTQEIVTNIIKDINNPQNNIEQMNRNVFKEQNVNREQIFQSSPYKNEILDNNNQYNTNMYMQGMKPRGNERVRSKLRHIMPIPIMEMLKNGLDNMAYNSDLNDNSEFGQLI